jgi:predicted Rossmann-fold nucleotide-binding protein
VIPDIDATDAPTNPFRSSLYDSDELLGGFRLDDPLSYADTLDFATYRAYVQNGRSSRVPPKQSIVRALHDNSISQALSQFVTDRKVVGMMGGHKVARNAPGYRKVVELSKSLSEAGFLMASGGGPGAMEATHLGAHFAGRSSVEIDHALDSISVSLRLPDNAADVVSADGTPDPGVLADLHSWQRPAFQIAMSSPRGAESLAIPTWQYGHEPPTPLASHIAKYYQNSIREDGLLAIATHGVIFTEGRAGTLQEVFQDAAQNYYRSFGWFSPMVLLGTDFWTRRFPVFDVLTALFDEVDERCVTVTDDLAEAVDAITSFTPPS